jgi:hypothetical protein
MSDPSTRDPLRLPAPAAGWASVLGLTCALLAAVPATAGDERRDAVGRCASPAGTLFQRQGPNKPWQSVRLRQPVSSGDLLLALPGGRAEIDSANGAVRLILWGNMPDLSRSAVLESAVTLHDSPGFDLDLTLERGRVVVASTKDKEPARIRVRVGEEVWGVTLPEKGDEAALERSGRWLRGVPFNPDPKAQDRPMADLVLLTLRGDMEVKAGPRLYAMHAPPGQGYFHWDSVDGQDSAPQRMDKMPAWADPGAGRTTEARRVEEALAALRQRLGDKPLDGALGELLDAADTEADKAQATVTRQVAVFSWGAIDDLPRLVAALTDPKRPEVRETAIDALRHWIGRGPGQDLQLYDFLIKQEKYAPTQAEVVLQLLHTPFQRDRPETYQTLIEYLRSDKVAVRELARWHLYRMAAAGRSIAFDAAAPAEDRAAAVKKWQELIPEGQLPPRPQPERK